MMNFIFDQVIDAIEKERPELEGWCEDKRAEYMDMGKLEALRWVAFSLDAKNQTIACRALGIAETDLPALKRILQVI
jgi:hypothetical protein